MKKEKKTKHFSKGLLCRLCLSLLLSFLLLCGYRSEDPKIFDQGELLTIEEEEKLQEEIVKRAQEMKMDILIVTTRDARGKTAREYADDFYDEGDFGYSTDGETGILFLIDMDNREYYVSTAGEAISLFTDRDIDDMLDDIYPYMAEGEYYRACREFLFGVSYYGSNADVAENGYYDPATNQFHEYTAQELAQMKKEKAFQSAFGVTGVLIRLAGSALCGAAVVGLMALQVRSKSKTSGAAYVAGGSSRLRDRADFRLNTTLRTRHIERNTGSSKGGGGHSSVHTSSGGSSHGGGGRHF